MVEKNKIFVFGEPKSGKLSLVEALFGLDGVDSHLETHSGLIHTVELSTKYYKKRIDLWIDEIEKDVSQTQLESFKGYLSEFRSEEYLEIREVLSGVIYCIDMDKCEYTEKHIESVVSELKNLCKQLETEQKPWGGLILCVGMHRKGSNSQNSKVSGSTVKEIFWDHEMDFVEYWEGSNPTESVKDEYGDLVGLARVREMVETIDWTNIQLTENPATKVSENENMDIMRQPLLDKENQDMELDVLLEKIKNAKSSAESIVGQEAKEKFAREFATEMQKFL